MIIHLPEILQQEKHTLLWSRIEWQKDRNTFPNLVWFRVPNPFGKYLTVQSDPFLIPILLAAMFLGEDIEVRGTISPKLAYHLKEYQHIFHFRFPKLLQPVTIEYQHLAPLEVTPMGVGTTFSGGVDSLFTLWKHLPTNQTIPDYQVTHAIFIHGFDILPGAQANYQCLYDRFLPWTQKLGVCLIPIETNIVSLTHLRLPLSYFLGPHIIATGQALGGLFHRFYIPSSWDYFHLAKKAYSSDPLVDPLLSTDTLEVINHGTTHRRVEKVAEIANWELPHNILWVCQEHRFETPTWNCSWCEKCIRTMIPLYALGKLDQFRTFAKPFRKNSASLWWARKFSLRHDFVSEMFPFVKEHKPDLLPWLWIAAFLGRIRYFLVTRLPKFAKHWFRRYGYYVTRNEAPDAYENPAVIETIRTRL